MSASPHVMQNTITSSVTVNNNYPHAHTISVPNMESLQEAIDTLWDKINEPSKAVGEAFRAEGQAVIFIIVGGQSVPIPFKRGDSLEQVITQLRLLLT